MARIILHIDLDSFYASLEEKRKPELKGKPVVVCVFSGRTENSGAVATANYLARELGIKAGMPISQAKELGKDNAIYIPTDMAYYRQASDRIMDILRTFSDKFEQRSVDEAYLDFSDKAKNFEEAKVFAEKIKKEILEMEGITCSVGIGPNKLIAKMAGKVKKPDGLTIIKPEEIKGFLENMPVKKLFGIGPKSLEIFEKLGIKTIGELANFDVGKLIQEFGENKGKEIWEKANGIDENPVEEVERQQISRLGTLKEDTANLDKILEKINELSIGLEEKIKQKKVKFKTVSIIAILKNLEAHTKSRSMDFSTNDIEIAKQEAKKLFSDFLKENPDKKLRRCGIRVSGFEEVIVDEKQKTLFSFSK